MLYFINKGEVKFMALDYTIIGERLKKARTEDLISCSCCRVDINNVWNYNRCYGVFLHEDVQRLLK